MFIDGLRFRRVLHRIRTLKSHLISCVSRPFVLNLQMVVRAGYRIFADRWMPLLQVKREKPPRRWKRCLEHWRRHRKLAIRRRRRIPDTSFKTRHLFQRQAIVSGRSQATRYRIERSIGTMVRQTIGPVLFDHLLTRKLRCKPPCQQWSFIQWDSAISPKAGLGALRSVDLIRATDAFRS